jgi:hypothetical protein
VVVKKSPEAKSHAVGLTRLGFTFGEKWSFLHMEAIPFARDKIECP